MSLTYLQQPASTKLDGNGNGQVVIKPDANQYWAPSFIRVATQVQTPPFAYCAVYHGMTGLTDPTVFIDDTFLGNKDSSSIISGVIVQFGESITVKWTGGNPGDTATAILYGEVSDDPPFYSIDRINTPGVHFSGRANTSITDNPILLNSGTLTAPANPATLTTGPFQTSTFQSWTGNITFRAPVPTTHYMLVNLLWSADAAGNIPIYIEDWILDSSINNYNSYFGHGPMFGPYLTIGYENYDNSPTTFSASIFGSQRIVTDTSIRAEAVMSVTSAADDDVLLNWDVNSIAPGGSAGPIPVGYYNGPVTVRFGAYNSNGINNTQLQLDFQPKAIDFNGDSSYLFAAPPSTTGLVYDVIQTIYLPKRPITASIFNSGTGATVNTRVRMIAGIHHGS